MSKPKKVKKKKREESLETYLIDIYVKEDEQAIMNISLAHLEKN